MKYLLIASALLLASCTRPPTSHPPQSEPIGADTLPARPDSVIVARPPSTLDKLLGRTPKPWKVVPIIAHQPIHLGKKSSVNVYYGAVTNAGKKATVAAGDGAVASIVEKKAGPAIVASDSVQQNAVGGPGNILATNGNNNTPTLTAPIQQPPDWRAMLAKPVGMALASVGTVLVVGGSIFLFAAYKRRKKLLA